MSDVSRGGWNSRIRSPAGFWKKRALGCARAEQAWRRGRYTVQTLRGEDGILVRGHTRGVRSLHVRGNRIASGSDDRTIKLWAADSGEWLSTLKGHQHSVLCVQMDGERIVSGSFDQSLCVWDVRTQQSVCEWRGHNFPVNCVQLSAGDGGGVERLVVSGGGDNTIKLWSERDPGGCVHTLTGHTAGVLCLRRDGHTLVSGSQDKTLRLWDLRRMDRLLTIRERHAVRSVRFCRRRVVAACGSFVRVYSTAAGTAGTTLLSINSGHYSPYNRAGGWRGARLADLGGENIVQAVGLSDRFVVSGGYSCAVKVWEPPTPVHRLSEHHPIGTYAPTECLRELHSHTDRVHCLQIDGDRIVTGAEDCTLKIFRFEPVDEPHTSAASPPCPPAMATHRGSGSPVAVAAGTTTTTSASSATSATSTSSSSHTNISTEHSSSSLSTSTMPTSAPALQQSRSHRRQLKLCFGKPRLRRFSRTL
jgi:WD40 repeat protein